MCQYLRETFLRFPSKFISLFVLFLFFWGLSACGGGKDSNKNNETSEQISLSNNGGGVTPVQGDLIEEGDDPPAADGILKLFEIISSSASKTENYTLLGSSSVGDRLKEVSISLNNVNSQKITLEDSNFNVPIVLSPGDNELEISAEDLDGNTYTLQLTITNTEGALPSGSLIDQAQKAGTLSEETALTYKVFASFNDSRLPDQFKGEDRTADYQHILDLVDEQWNRLSPEGQEKLFPFLVPPFYEGSWHDLKTKNNNKPLMALDIVTPCKPWVGGCPISADWEFVGGTHVKVWYLTKNASTDREIAGIIAATIDNRAWDKLTNVMNKTPIPDSGSPMDGDDTRLDISLVELSPGVDGTTHNSNLGKCKKTPVYIVMNRLRPANQIIPASVHEFMHAIQYSYDVKAACLVDYRWLTESTATWAVDYVFEKITQWEHKYLDYYQDLPQQSLDSQLPKGYSYGAYVFPFFLSHTVGAASIGNIFSETEKSTGMTVLDDGLAASGQKLDDIWRDFVLFDWNREPVDQFKKWDAIPRGAASEGNKTKPVELSLGGSPDKEVPIALDLPYLSAKYYHYKFSDSDIRTVQFLNGVTFKLSKETVTPAYGQQYAIDDISEDQKKGAKVQAMLKINGAWENPKEWTNSPFKSFCRDKKNERIEEMVIIISNSDISKPNQNFQPQGEGPKLRLTNTGCWQWKGNASFTKTNGGVTESFKASKMVWEYDTEMVFPSAAGGKAPVGQNYKMVSGNVSWSIGGSNGNCSYSGSGSFNLAGSINTYQNLSHVLGEPGHRGIILTGFDNAQSPFMVNSTEGCVTKDGTTITVKTKPLGDFFVSILAASSHGKVSSDGKTIKGTGADTRTSGVTGSWQFDAQVQ